MFAELVEQLQTTLHGFELEQLHELFKQFVVNLGNMSDGLKMLGSIMEMRKDAGMLSKPAFNEARWNDWNASSSGVYLRHLNRYWL